MPMGKKGVSSIKICRCFFRLADLSLEFELEKAPTIEDLLTVIVNREDVESIIRRPVSSISLPLVI